MHLLLRFPASGGQSGYFRREHGFRKRPKDGMGAGWRREKQGFLHPIREHARFARCAKSYVSSGTIISNKQSCFAGEQSSSRFPSLRRGFDSRRPLQESHACLYRQAFRFNAAKKTVILSRFSFPSITYRSTLLRNLNLSKAPVFFSLLYRTCVVNVIELAELFYFKVL